jgi:lysophospholipase L1-like esterase
MATGTSTTGRSGRRRRIAFAAIGVIVALLASEGTMWLAGVPEPTWRKVRIAGFPDGGVERLSSINPIVVPHPARWWTLSPSFCNAQGMHGRPFEQPKPVGRKRVVILGDSVFVMVQEGGDDLAGVLADALRIEGMNADIVNASCMGYSTAQAARWWHDAGAAWEADLVILATGWNDLYRPIGASDLLWQQRVDAEIPRLRLALFDAFASEPPPDRRVSPAGSAALAQAIAADAKARSAAFAWIALPIGPDARALRTLLVEERHALTDADSIAERFAERRAAITAVVGEPIDWRAGWSEPRPAWFDADQIHLTRLGVEHAAAWLAPHVIAALER